MVFCIICPEPVYIEYGCKVWKCPCPVLTPQNPNVFQKYLHNLSMFAIVWGLPNINLFQIHVHCQEILDCAQLTTQAGTMT